MRTTLRVPTCKCLHGGWPGPTLHRPGCKRMAAIRKKYGASAPSAQTMTTQSAMLYLFGPRITDAIKGELQ